MGQSTRLIPIQPESRHQRVSRCFRSRISSVGKVLDCRAKGRWFDSREGLRNEKGTPDPFALQAVRPSRGSDDHVK